MKSALLHTLLYSLLVGLTVNLYQANSRLKDMDSVKDSVLLEVSEDYVGSLNQRPYVDLWEHDASVGNLRPLPALKVGKKT